MISRWLWGATAVLAVIVASWLSGLGSLSNSSPATGDFSPVMLAQPYDSVNALSNEGGVLPGHIARFPAADLSQMTRTFRAARMDGRLWAGPDGHLIIDRALRHWFDSWLSLQGEWILDDIVFAMQQQFDSLGEPAATEAKELFQTYIDYREALGEYDDRTGRSLVLSDIDVLVQRLDWVERLRREFFSEQVVQAFFAADEALDQHLLMRRQLQLQGASVDDIQALEQALPADIRQSREQSHSLRNMHERERAWQQLALGEDTLAQKKYAYRSQQWGEAAAQRLARLDQQQHEWQQRIAEYARYRDQLSMGNKGTVSEEDHQALDLWLQQHFSEQELRRVPGALAAYLTQQGNH